ncbi:hypothetical protein HJC23_002203 [Cyclotella cryptica]|uniref:BTB domain-containing protein n=1 Tax=Cyclotella cryptica TaxID=29204 RepID=A0ABD3Q7A5_9STRA|eukprot:CCRYP_008229-RA/>CCRYP_008229-RA protein AED:0.01 eAED:0.01 QI:0/-1/0/1/-1/1/1/0/538
MTTSPTPCSAFASPPSSTSNKSGTTLLADIRSLLNNEELTDIVLVPTVPEPSASADDSTCRSDDANKDGDVTGEAVPAIKSILAARSPVFRRMLYGDFRETRLRNDNDDGVLSVKLEYSANVLRLLVEFCFTDRLDSLEGGDRNDDEDDDDDSRNGHDGSTGSRGGSQTSAVSSPSLSGTARLLTSLSSAAHYFDIPKLEHDILSRLNEMMTRQPSLACVVLDEANRIMQEELCQVALERIRARPKAALLPYDNVTLVDSGTMESWRDKGGVVSLGASLLERVVFDDVSTASEWTKFTCLQRWVEGCPHQVSRQAEALFKKELPFDEERDGRRSNLNNDDDDTSKSSHKSHHEQKRAIAAHLAQKLDLSLIPASDLDTVSHSQLLSTQDLFKAYRLQALNAERTKSKVFVEGAGISEINGTYIQGGVHEGIPMYNKEGVWRDREEVFRIFLCTYSNGNKSWCISIVPKGKEPGKTTDIDFYECPVTYGGKGAGVGPYSGGGVSENGMGVVPSRGWKLVNFGQPPAPKCHLIAGCLEDA